MWSLRRSLALLVAAPCFVLLWAPGCSQQSEGERCDFQRSGDSDCEPPLVCVEKTQLNNGDADRCCPPAGQTITDDRCLPNNGTAGTGGKDGGTGGSDSGTGGADASSGGAAGSGGVAGSGGAAGSGGTGGVAGSGGTGGAAGSGGSSGDAATDTGSG